MEFESGRRTTFYVQRACATHLNLAAGQFECEVKVNNLPAKALLDSGTCQGDQETQLGRLNLSITGHVG